MRKVSFDCTFALSVVEAPLASMSFDFAQDGGSR
jgi:hypothetical protein